MCVPEEPAYLEWQQFPLWGRDFLSEGDAAFVKNVQGVVFLRNIILRILQYFPVFVPEYFTSYDALSEFRKKVKEERFLSSVLMLTFCHAPKIRSNLKNRCPHNCIQLFQITCNLFSYCLLSSTVGQFQQSCVGL